MLEVKANGGVYWPGMILGVIGLAQGAWDLWHEALRSGGGAAVRPALFALWMVPTAVGLVFNVVWAIASYRMADSRAKCRAVIVCCIVELIVTAVGGVELVLQLGAGPVMLLPLIAAAVWMLLLALLYVGIAREVHDYAVSQGYMPRF
ncbi:hypothetical protein DSM100685_1248 [Bifidobacterium avesanii]|nr:hypothetical protein DSM100685_1248 [Bifidobacterium avesanii]